MLSRLKKFFQLPVWFLKNLWRQFNQDNCFVLAASLSYTTLLALIPLLATSLIFIKAFPAFQNLEGQLENFVLSHFVAGSAELIQAHIHQFLEQTLKLSALGSLFLLVTSVLLIFTMEKTFNHIWKTTVHRKGVPTFFMYWGILTLLPVFIALGLAIINYIVNWSLMIELTKFVFFKTLLSNLVGYFLTIIVFFFLYLSLPNCKVKVSCAFIGSVFAALLLGGAKEFFSIYIRYFSNYEFIYGSLAAIPLFLVWLYIIWLIILLGVETTYVLQKLKYHEPSST
jgi:membrane protein